MALEYHSGYQVVMIQYNYTMCISFPSCYTVLKRGLSRWSCRRSSMLLINGVSDAFSRFHGRRISQTGRFGKDSRSNRFSNLICTRRLQLFGHTVWTKEDQDHSTVLNTSLAPPKSWSRRRSRPRRTWLRTVEDNLRPLNIGLHTARRRALDREAWHQSMTTAPFARTHDDVRRLISQFLQGHSHEI